MDYQFAEGDYLERKTNINGVGWMRIAAIGTSAQTIPVEQALEQCRAFPAMYRIMRPVLAFQVTGKVVP